MNIVLIAHYYPPINSSGAKRAEALSKYFTAFGHSVSVITPSKTRADGDFTEKVPNGVKLIELNWLGRERPSVHDGAKFEPMYIGKPSWKRRAKDWVMAKLGQVPDPRLPFAMSFLSPWLALRARRALQEADIVIGTTPPWPMVLAALLCKWRFGKRCILDYRDHFSECHEMPGGEFAKWLERVIDRRMVRSADHVVCISEPMSSYYRTLTPAVTTILNGYDHELLDDARLQAPKLSTDGKIRIRYMGTVSPGRVPHNVLRALVLLREQNPDAFARIRIEFFGNAALIQEALQTRYLGIESAFAFIPPVPYLKSLQKMIEADYLLFSETSSQQTLSAQGILTTKLFEYIGSGRPILGDISTETLAGGLLKRCGAQNIVGQSPDLFLAAFEDPAFYIRKPDTVSHLSTSLSRRAQAEQYIALAQDIVGRT